MSTIVTRAGKGSALTFTEADANFNNLNTDKIQVSDITGATSKATLVDADVLPLVDSVGGLLNKGTWANIKTTLASTFAAIAGSVSQIFSASSIELGHASDTTLTRVSAGVVAVEGSNVLLASGLGSVTQAYDVDTAKLDVDQSWTGAQRGTYVTLTDAATIALDLSANNFFKVLLGGNRTLGAPTSTVAGQSGVITCYQDATGSRTLAYAWPYHFAGGSAPTLSTAKFAKDTLAYNVDFYANLTVTAITNGANAVATANGHGMFTGQKCQFSALSGSTGLATATNYWITVVDANTFKFSSSLANCIAGTFITTSSVFTSGTLEASTITLTSSLGVS